MDGYHAAFQEETLSWAAGAGRDEKFIFLKALLNCFTPGELGKVKGICSRAKRRKLRNGEVDIEDGVDVDTDEGVVVGSSPEVVGPTPCGTPVVHPERVMAQPQPRPWWKYWMKKETRSLDCEFVEMLSGRGIDRHKAGTVSIVDSEQHVLSGFPMTVLRTPGSYLTSPVLFKLNGIGKFSLQNGTPLGVVQKRVEDCLDGKLCVGSGIEADFRSLDMCVGDFKKVRATDNKKSSGIFDLQWHWRKHQRNEFGEIIHDKHGNPVTQGIGIRSLYHYYFHEDIHAGVHDPSRDAMAAMRLFQEIYVNIKKTNLHSMHCESDEVFDEIPTFKK